MAHSDERLRQIYDKTGGHCHICGKKLAFTSYGFRDGARGSWEVDHSTPRAKGGTNHLGNLFAICVACNIEKGTKTSQHMRRKKGVSLRKHGVTPSHPQESGWKKFWNNMLYGR